jgi:hypothetical protein
MLKLHQLSLGQWGREFLYLIQMLVLLLIGGFKCQLTDLILAFLDMTILSTIYVSPYGVLQEKKKTPTMMMKASVDEMSGDEGII